MKCIMSKYYNCKCEAIHCIVTFFPKKEIIGYCEDHKDIYDSLLTGSSSKKYYKAISAKLANNLAVML